MKHLIFPFVLAAVTALTAEAAVSELAPNLASDDLVVRFQAQSDLLKEASHAGRPGAEAERAAYCRELCRALSNDCPPRAAAQLVRQLQRIGGEESVDTLRGLLSHPDTHLRDDVRQALETNPSPRAGEVLLEAWQQSDNETWTLGVINSLAVRGDPRAVTPLTAAVQDPNPRIAGAALAALGRIPDQTAATALHRALETTEGSTRDQNAHALLEFAHQAARRGNGSLAARLYRSLTEQRETVDVRTSAWIGLLTALPEQAAELAEPISNPVVLGAAIDASTQIESPALVDKIAEQLGDAAPDIQLRILGALESAGDAKHAASVAALLTADDSEIARGAASTLGVIGTYESVPALMDAAANNAVAKQALARIPSPELGKHLLATATDRESERRVLAIEILSQRGGDGLAQQLLALADDPDERIAGAALTSLEGVATTEHLDAIATRMLETESSSLARKALGTVIAVTGNASDPDAAVQILAGKLPDASASGQALVFQALARTGSDATLQPVIAAATSPDADRRAAAVKALSSWSNPKGIEPMLKVAGNEATDLKSHVLIMRGVSRLLSAERRLNIKQCEQALQAARRPDEKKMLLGALGQSKDKSALAVIEPYLDDPEVMEEAKLAAEAVRSKRKR